MLKALVGKEDSPKLPTAISPLYDLPPEAREAAHAEMPTFDQWGLLPEGKAPRENNPRCRAVAAESEGGTEGSAGSSHGAESGTS